MSEAIIEHKRHVSEAMESLHFNKRRKNSKSKKLFRRGVLNTTDNSIQSFGMNTDTERNTDIERNIERNTEPIKHATTFVGSGDHTPFTARPHPLITAEDLCFKNISGSSDSVQTACNISSKGKAVSWGC